MAYDSFVVMEGLSFQVWRGEIFVIMGGSGSGKSTLLKTLIGLEKPAHGQILFDGEDFGAADGKARKRMLRRMGVLYQNGALWSGLTLAENVALPIEEFTSLDEESIADVVSLKLALVGLRGFESFYPATLSGGMRKRAALARALALDPEVLFFDEPSSGLDPVSASRLDDLILQLSASFGSTIVVMPARFAPNTFSFNPPIGSTRPRSVISPVIATSRRTGRPDISETSAVAIAMPADGPSLGIAPAGT